MLQVIRRIVAEVRNVMALRRCPEQEHQFVSDRMSDRWRLRCIECGGHTRGWDVEPGNLDRGRPAVIVRLPVSKLEQTFRIRQFKSQVARRSPFRMVS